MPQPDFFKNIFRTKEGGTDNYSLLEKVTEQHPYFGVAQFYLLKTLLPQKPGFEETAARTALFFNDLFLLNKQLITEEVTTAVLPDNPSPAPITHSTEHKTADNFLQQNKKEELLFEPLHASDYFASQGIKLSEAVAESDKLGKQLKSFTAWLKTMKKVHPDKMQAGDATVDTAVRSLAEKSNAEEDVITEAMAEAYILQNKREKAIELYTKLSLLNPSKSAYFAAKIDSLNT